MDQTPSAFSYYPPLTDNAILLPPQQATEPHSISSVTSDICPALQSDFFYPSTVATKTLYAFLTHIMRATCNSNLIL